MLVAGAAVRCRRSHSASLRSAMNRRDGADRPMEPNCTPIAEDDAQVAARRRARFSTKRSAGIGIGVAAQPRHHRGRRGGALPHAARHRRRARWSQALDDDRAARHRARRAVRRRRLFHADVLRPVRAAHDRPQGSALSHRRARRLHQLFDRPQCRRQRVHRRRGALPHLFGLGARRHRGGQDLLHRRPDVLARQRHRARARHRL